MFKLNDRLTIEFLYDKRYCLKLCQRILPVSYAIIISNTEQLLSESENYEEISPKSKK